MRIETPFGPAWATVQNGALTGLGFGDDLQNEPAEGEVVRQVAEYFAGTRQAFDLPLKPEGSEFQKRVWDELVRIPFGETISYLSLIHISEPTRQAEISYA